MSSPIILNRSRLAGKMTQVCILRNSAILVRGIVTDPVERSIFSEKYGRRHGKRAREDVTLIFVPVLSRKKRFAYEPSGPSGRSLSRFPYKATRKISTPPGWDANPSQGYPSYPQQ